ncbi:MAG TPA: hypothetical protein VFA72_22595 [Burkholderiales bacterium]|nr:hypothetical protein [Burkholderiales bacterium]
MAELALRIEDERTVLEPHGAGAPSLLLHGLGWKALARDHLKHDPPSSLELENAIAAIEDEIARVRALPAKGLRLQTDDVRVREIALAAGVPAGEPMTIQAVEQSFQRLAARSVSGGRSGDGIPPGNERAATLVIPRELMHHLGFSAILWP